MLLPGLARALSFDFEDSNLDGWLLSEEGSAAHSHGIETHNGSLMAFSAHAATNIPQVNTSGTTSLSQSFAFDAPNRVMFDMHAVGTSASYGSRVVHARSGLKLTFRDVFNATLGSAGLYFVTSSSLLPANGVDVGSTQLPYDVTMGELAGLAGLDPSSIASVTFSFEAYSQWNGGGNIQPDIRSTAQVWFDDFAIVPEPSTALLLGFGLTGIAITRRR